MTALDTMTTPAPVRTVPDRMARVLLAVASVGALASALLAAGEVASADGATKMALTWQAYGLVVFAGLFALLARRPRGYRGVWELVIFHKVALTVTAAAYAAHGGIDGTGAVLVGDGIVSALLITAYVLARGWSRG
jgi:hypothetical protein